VTEFLGSTYNELGNRQEDGSYLPFIELVILTSSATYHLTNTGQIGKDRSVHDFRIGIGPGGLRTLAADLIEYADKIERVGEDES